MSNIRVEEVRGVEALNALRGEWQSLFRATDAPAFLSWEWLATWQRWLSRGQTPVLLCARAGGALVGLLALGCEERRVLGSPLMMRRLSLLGAGLGGADYLDVIALPQHASAAAAAIFEHLATRVEFDVLELDGLADDSPNLPIIERCFAAETKFRRRLTPRFACPQMELSGAWESVLKQTHRARNFKQKLRQLSARAGFEFRPITQPADAVAAFERYLALHEGRWQNAGGSDATGHEALRAFQRDVVLRLANAGLLRFEELWVEGECIASIYGLDDGRRYCLYSTGYDTAWRQASPGLVLFGLSIEAALARGVRHYDFLRGNESYKFDWANAERRTVAVTVARRRLPATMQVVAEGVEACARRAAKSVLPAQTAERLGAWLRRQQRAQALGERTQPEIAANVWVVEQLSQQ